MLTVEGTYKDGKIELREIPEQIHESKVLVTFVEPNVVDLQTRKIDQAQAGDLRFRLKTFAEDWNRPEMDIYDRSSPR
jgi:hypothetical protein